MRSAGFGVLALPSVGVWALTGWEAPWVGVRTSEFDRVFFDGRRPQALTFGDNARQLGARTQAIMGEIDDPCFGELRHRWRTARNPVAGMTDLRVLFLMETMAADVGLRLVTSFIACEAAVLDSRTLATWVIA